MAVSFKSVGVVIVLVALGAWLYYATTPSEAVRLARALTIAKTAPLWGMAGTDPDKLDDAVSKLADTQKKLAALQPTPEDAALVASSLYPITFLHAVAALERARLAFIASSTESNFSRYVAAQKTARDAYTTDLRAFRAAFIKVVPENTAGYGTTAGIVTRASALNAMDGLMRMANNAPVAATPSSLSVGTTPQPYSSTTLADILDMYSNASAYPLPSRPVQLTTGTCTAALSAPAIYNMYGQTYFGISVPAPTFVGDILLIKTSAYSTLPYYQYYISHGVDYVVWRPSSHYTCPDFAGDAGLINAILNVQQVAQNHPLSAFASTSNKVQLTHLESVLSLPVPAVARESDARSYVALAQTMLADGTLDSGAADTVSSLTLMLQQKSAGFEYMIYRMAAIEDIDMHVTKEGAKVELAAPYLFFVRGAFFSLFLGAHEPPALYVSPVSSKTESSLPLVSYVGTPGISRQTVIQDMRFYFKLHAPTE